MAREVTLPQVFRDDRLERVLAHAQIADQLGMVLGPMLAALVLDWWRWQWVVGVTGEPGYRRHTRDVDGKGDWPVSPDGLNR